MPACSSSPLRPQEELDRREQLVQHLTAQNEDLVSTVETLKAEVLTSNEEAERASRELDALRSRALQENAEESFLRERELRETQGELERCRIERDEWERTCMQERVVADDAKTVLETLRRDQELERELWHREAEELAVEREKVANLQSVLEDFQAGKTPSRSLMRRAERPVVLAKDHELRQAVKEYETQLTRVTLSLAEYKHRALQAEVSLFRV